MERSVSSRDRSPVTTKAIVEANGDHVHVLRDPVVHKGGKSRISDRERIIPVPHEQMVVFDAHRPIRGEAILVSNTNDTTPAGSALRGELGAEGIIDDA